MMYYNLVYLILICSVIILNSVLCYDVPPAKLEAIHPKGLRVSIPGIYYI